MISRLQQLTTAPSGSRLEQLVIARDDLNREISRERAYQERVAGIVARVEKANRVDEAVERCVDIAAAWGDVPTEAIYSTDRSKHVVAARHVAMWLLRDAGMSLPAIGATLGRDHTSVLYGVRRVERDGELLAVARGLVEKRSA